MNHPQDGVRGVSLLDSDRGLGEDVGMLMALAILAGSLVLYYFYLCLVTRKLEARGLAGRSAKLHAILKTWWGRPALALVCLAVGFAIFSIVGCITR
jgi:hypothetical protein